jgi:glycosyltransferase involved in cell wall biosynthesis
VNRVNEIRRDQLRAPARVVDVDVESPDAGESVDVNRYASVWCLVRRNGVVSDARFFDVEGQSALCVSSLREYLSNSADVPAPRASDPRPRGLTVVIPTNRGDNLPTVLKSLMQQSDSDFSVLVVDNSADGHIHEIATAIDGLDLTYCREPTPGISRARNAALAQLTSEFVAWIDDDEEADVDWVAWIKRGFGHASRPDVVVGAMVPAELETAAQVNFERFGGFNKGRPMQPVELRAGTDAVRDPLYPLPSFGAGGNMAFRTEILRSIGGFDIRLGSPAIRGGEETRALSEILERGSTILHWPLALTWHYHRRTDDELERQFYGYSTGLSAFYVSSVLASPRYAWRVLRLLPRGFMQTRGSHRVGVSDEAVTDFPEHLLRAGRRGLYLGGWLYLRETIRQWRTR